MGIKDLGYEIGDLKHNFSAISKKGSVISIMIRRRLRSIMEESAYTISTN